VSKPASFSHDTVTPNPSRTTSTHTRHYNPSHVALCYTPTNIHAQTYCLCIQCQGMKLTTQLHFVPWLGASGKLPQLSNVPARCAISCPYEQINFTTNNAQLFTKETSSVHNDFVTHLKHNSLCNRL